MDERRKAYKRILRRKGMMLVISAPPGAGKTSLTQALLDSDPDTVVSVSCTTRDQRPGEVEGKDYYFVTEDKFRDMIDKGELLEYAQVYNKSFYGTPRAPVEKAMDEGKDVIFVIDWQGHLKLKATMEEDVVSIYILPPEFKELEERMVERGRDSDKDIELRLKKAIDEMSHYKEYQYMIINDEFDRAALKLKSILIAERLKRSRLRGIKDFVDKIRPGESIV